MNISEALVECCVQHGLKDVFCITGGHALFLNSAFSKSDALKVTYFHHEQAAAMAADAYYRIHNRPAIVNVSAGPAALNTINGVYGSFVDSIPVIFISGQPKYSQLVRSTALPLRQYGDQEFDKITDLVKPIVKFSCLMDESHCPFQLLEHSIQVSLSGRPGPVWIDVPMNIQSASYNPSDTQKNTFKNSYYLRSSRGITDHQIELIFHQLEKSKRPIIYAGPHIRPQGAIDHFRELVEILQIPVVTSWNSHDLLSTSHDLYVGRPGLRGERVGNWITHASDFILILGEHLSTRQVGTNPNEFSPNSFKIWIDSDLQELGKPSLDIDIPIYANLPSALGQIIQYADTNNFKKFPEHKNWASKCKQLWNQYRPQPSTMRVKIKSTLIMPYMKFLIPWMEEKLL